MNFDVSQIGSLLLAILVVFLVYRRFRRSFGQQPLCPVRMRVRAVLLLVIGGLLLPTALRSSAFMAALLGGLGVGVALAVWGAARTRFLRAGTQLYYVCYYCIVLWKAKRVTAEEISPGAPAPG